MGYLKYNVRFQQNKYENKTPKQNEILLFENEAWKAYFLIKNIYKVLKYKVS